MNRREYEAIMAKGKRLHPPIEKGDSVFVKTGKMAGTYATVMYVIDKFVYLKHQVTDVEFRCNIHDVGWTA